jgi:Amt family ammonium transporter
MWILFGFTLVYGNDLGGFIGNLQFAFYRGVSSTTCYPNGNPNDTETIPIAAFAQFEMMFAAISPLLVTGAYCERVNLRTSLIYTVLWSIFVYYPVAHWVWGGGWLFQHGVQVKTTVPGGPE